MADGQDQDQKTEAPSGKRLDEARERGQLPVSREATTWVIMLGILAVMGWVVPMMLSQMVAILRVFLEAPESFELDDRNLQALLYHIVGQVAMATGIAFMVMVAAVVGGVMLQTGFLWAPELLSADFERLKPSFKKLFSLRQLVELFKGCGKLGFLGGIAFWVIAPIAIQSPSFTGMPLETILVYTEHQIIYLIALVLLGFTLIAAGDLWYTRYSYMQDLRMTKQEVKDEYKQQEGDPMIKSRLRQMRIEKARKRMMAQVPKADVVITNPTHYAIALQYDGEKMPAPVVVAKGINLIAERIREVALENRIPLVSNPPLARALHDSVEVDRQIPAQHYRAVAEVISYVYKLRKRPGVR